MTTECLSGNLIRVETLRIPVDPRQALNLECKGARIGLTVDNLQSVRAASCWAGLDYGKLVAESWDFLSTKCNKVTR